ncbi:MAG: hypothetical protein ACE15F_24760 [bacterium]
MDAYQEQFLRDEFFSLTLMATVQRADVYTSDPDVKDRKAFRNALRSKLEQIAQGYKKQVPEETHIRNIVNLSTSLTSAYAKVLKDGRFRIGTAQKALNLYLKYLWCLGKIPPPPHCPFDSLIIAKLPAYKGPRWTALASEQEYRTLVSIAKDKAQRTPLAVWELQIYNKARSFTAEESGSRGNRQGKEHKR